MAKPNPKQNFLQSLLLITTIYLGVLLIWHPGGQSGPTKYAGQELKSPDQIIASLRAADLKIMDLDAAQKLYPALQNELKQEVTDKKITQAQADELLIEGSVLVADTQLKAGIMRNESGRVRAAYQTLVGLEKQHVDSPQWTKEYDLPRKPGDTRFSWSRASGQALYAQTVEELSSRNRGDLIWGFIPGGFMFIDFLVRMTGAQPAFSYAFAAFLLALVVRAIVFPLTQKQLMFGRQMSQLTPLVNEIKKKYDGKDQAEMNAKVMELYREYGINPMAGCGPALLQMPLFLTVYQCMLHYQFEFQKGVFLWMNPSTSKLAPAVIAPNLGQRDLILIVIYGVSMVISTLLTPVSDPTQVKQQRMMGVGMSVMFTFFMFTGAFPVPAAFVLYWTFTNLLAMAQSFRTYRLPLPPLQKVNAPGGGVYPQGAQSKWMQRLEELQRQSQDQKKGGTSTNGQVPKAEVLTGEVKTGTPAKHKPKRRK